jgi:ADP-dependent NAD(P)H-hydrate dehydratase / NAD(P)H-hydrate epimerase
VYLVTSEQMQSLDRHTLTTLRVPGIVLMDHAGKAVAVEVAAKQPNSVVVLCGKGNNGGDGWMAARWLQHWRVPNLSVLTTEPIEHLEGEAYLAAQIAQASGVPYAVYQSGMEVPPADVYVDALLGTGTTRPLEGHLGELVERVNECSGWTVAVDVPSGVDGSTGVVPGLAIRAEVTVCMGLQKLGTAVTPGSEWAGQVRVADIGIALQPNVPYAEWVTPERVSHALPKRGPLTHKGTFGKVGICVGEMQGASVLAGLGAARVGTGLVVLGHRTDLTLQVPYEFVTRRCDVGEVATRLADCHALVVGPGLGVHADRWRDVVFQHTDRGVLDADGFRILERDRKLPVGNWVLTPHPKECADLLGWTTAQVQARRLEAASLLAKQVGGVVVLKGHHSLIVDETGRTMVNPTGDDALATAGTGDVLAGMIGGLLAQGLSPFDAAASAVWLHGKAGEFAGSSASPISTIASDVVENISRAINHCFDTDTFEPRSV